jgi:hypothetical protein
MALGALYMEVCMSTLLLPLLKYTAMRKLFTLLLLVITTPLLSQTNPITGIIITLPQNPDAALVKWGAGTLTLSASTKMVNGRVEDRVRDCRILLIIKKSGTVVCGSFNSSSAPSANFSSANKVWSGKSAVALLGQDCTLPPGDYELCVQFFGNGPAGVIPFSDEKCKSFSIKSQEESFNPPVLIDPADGFRINESDLKKPRQFRWMQAPKPRDVTYKLKVWELRKGENSTQAMLKEPVVVKDVKDQPQTIVQLQQPLPGGSFVWNVQALDRDGKPVGSNKGLSETFIINVNPVNDEPSVITLVQPAKGSVIPLNSNPLFTWTHERKPEGPASIYKIKIVEIKGDQSPEEALRSNKPFFEKDSIEDLLFHYTGNLPRFEQDKKYAWQVSASRNPPYGEVNIIQSGVSVFVVRPGQRGPGNPTTQSVSFCTDFEAGLGGWQGDHTAISIITSGGNPGNYAQTTDQSGASSFFNIDASYTGNWSDVVAAGCGSLCFDVKYISNASTGTNPVLTMTPTISIRGNGFTASFITSGPITVGDGWHSYCAPLKYLNADGTMPSNGNGHWIMAGTATAADWNTLLNNVDKVWLPTDPSSYQGEIFGYDNICIKSTGDCGPQVIIPCVPCDSTTINASNQSIVSLNAATGSISIRNSISTASNITKIVADLVCVIIKPNNTNCNVCNKETNQQNQFEGSNQVVPPAGWAMNGKGEIAQESVNGITRSLTFTSASIGGVNINSGVIINHELGITPASCCGDKIEVWIRYTLWDRSCHVCDKLVKATLERPSVCSTGTDVDHH